MTYQMIENIKLPVTFCREYSVSVSYNFLIRQNEMLIDLLSESCEEGENFSIG